MRERAVPAEGGGQGGVLAWAAPGEPRPALQLGQGQFSGSGEPGFRPRSRAPVHRALHMHRRSSLSRAGGPGRAAGGGAKRGGAPRSFKPSEGRCSLVGTTYSWMPSVVSSQAFLPPVAAGSCKAAGSALVV